MLERLVAYQRRTVQMLYDMGRKARVFLPYKTDVYKNDIHVQKALMRVYGDIIAFCQKAFRFKLKNGENMARVKGVALSLFRDYESYFDQELRNFDQHLEEVESSAATCDKKRIDQIRRSQQEQHKEIVEMITENEKRQNIHQRKVEQIVADNEKRFQLASDRDEIIVEYLERRQNVHDSS